MDDEEEKKRVWAARREFENAADELSTFLGKKPIYEQSQKQYSQAIPPLCSFCGKGKNQVKLMLPGNNAYICNECVLVALDIIEGS